MVKTGLPAESNHLGVGDGLPIGDRIWLAIEDLSHQRGGGRGALGRGAAHHLRAKRGDEAVGNPELGGGFRH